jgi:hypothetical protein
MMQSIVEGLRACSPHDDLSTFSALSGDGSDASEATECFEVAQANGVVGVAEETGKDKGPNTG